jgi:hypothetical protein
MQLFPRTIAELASSANLPKMARDAELRRDARWRSSFWMTRNICFEHQEGDESQGSLPPWQHGEWCVEICKEDRMSGKLFTWRCASLPFYTGSALGLVVFHLPKYWLHVISGRNRKSGLGLGFSQSIHSSKQFRTPTHAFNLPPVLSSRRLCIHTAPTRAVLARTNNSLALHVRKCDTRNHTIRPNPRTPWRRRRRTTDRSHRNGCSLGPGTRPDGGARNDIVCYAGSCGSFGLLGFG